MQHGYEVKKRKRRRKDREYLRVNRTRVAIALGVLIGVQCHADKGYLSVPAWARRVASDAKIPLRMKSGEGVERDWTAAGYLARVIDLFIEATDEDWDDHWEARLMARGGGIERMGILENYVRCRVKNGGREG